MSGQIFGFIAGLFIDSLSTDPMGINMLTFTIVGFVTGLLHKRIYHEGFLSASVIIFLITILEGILYSIINIISGFNVDIIHNFRYTIIYESVFNAFIGAIVFFILKKVNTHLRRVFS